MIRPLSLALILQLTAAPWAGTARFECVFTKRASADGVKKENLELIYLLDAIRKKAYRVEDRQNLQIEYYMDMADTVITFIEVTAEKRCSPPPSRPTRPRCTAGCWDNITAIA